MERIPPPSPSYLLKGYVHVLAILSNLVDMNSYVSGPTTYSHF
jgi:hypothetical protein